MKPAIRKFQSHACPRCHGDLYLDDEDLTCLQCGRRVQVLAKAPLVPELHAEVDEEERRHATAAA